VLPFQLVPGAQLEDATLVAKSWLVLYRKNVRPACGTGADVEPELPVATVVFVLG
jgi:hypothetical protein